MNVEWWNSWDIGKVCVSLDIGVVKKQIRLSDDSWRAVKEKHRSKDALLYLHYHQSLCWV